MELQGGRVALTGATGFVGGHIAEALLAAGAHVIGVVRNPSKGAWLEALGVELRRADLLEPEALASAFEGCDALVSNAALSSFAGALSLYESVNLDGGHNVLQAATDRGVTRVVLISSAAVYRPRLRHMTTEQDELLDLSGRRHHFTSLTTDWRYTRTKRMAEQRAWSHATQTGMQLTALRPGPVYGSRDPKLTRRYLRAMERRLTLAPTVGIPQVHARDVGEAVVGALRNPNSAGRAYNLAGPPTSPLDVYRHLKTIMGRGPTLVPVPIPLWVGFDCRAAERDLGFTSRPLEQGLQEVISHELG